MKTKRWRDCDRDRCVTTLLPDRPRLCGEPHSISDDRAAIFRLGDSGRGVAPAQILKHEGRLAQDVTGRVCRQWRLECDRDLFYPFLKGYRSAHESAVEAARPRHQRYRNHGGPRITAGQRRSAARPTRLICIQGRASDQVRETHSKIAAGALIYPRRFGPEHSWLHGTSGPAPSTRRSNRFQKLSNACEKCSRRLRESSRRWRVSPCGRARQIKLAPTFLPKEQIMIVNFVRTGGDKGHAVGRQSARRDAVGMGNDGHRRERIKKKFS